MDKQIWPGWETVRVIGTGGFGKVYEIRKIEDSSTGVYRSALKVVTIPQSPDEYASYKDDGYDEAGITSIFKSQVDDIVSEFALMSQFKGTANIVSYEDHMIVRHDDGHGWDVLIRMELLTSLPEYYAKNGMRESGAVKLGTDICRALELCAQKNIIHRDIKPQNIFVNEFGDFKLGDFGIARAMDHTTKATKVGTYSYMAPEVYKNRPYNATGDIYSLGLVLYWLMNERRLPFVPMPPTVPTASQNSEAQMRRISGETIPESKYGSRAMKQIVMKACACEPSKRFANAREMRLALERVLAGKTAAVPGTDSSESAGDRARKMRDAAEGKGAAEAERPGNADKTRSIWDDAKDEAEDGSYSYAFNKGERRDTVQNHRLNTSTKEPQPEPTSAQVRSSTSGVIVKRLEFATKKGYTVFEVHYSKAMEKDDIFIAADTGRPDIGIVYQTLPKITGGGSRHGVMQPVPFVKRGTENEKHPAITTVVFFIYYADDWKDRPLFKRPQLAANTTESDFDEIYAMIMDGTIDPNDQSQMLNLSLGRIPKPNRKAHMPDGKTACPVCNGTGHVEVDQKTLFGTIKMEARCRKCRGKGYR